MNKDKKEWDVFISHAWEDKNFADRLAALLKEMGVDVWYDTYVLEIGDSLTNKISEGLANSGYGVVIMSPNFFKKDWTNREVNSLLQKEIKNKKVILPIWHNITFEEMQKVAPLFTDKLALNTENDSLEKIARSILKVVKPKRTVKDSSKLIEVKYENDTEMVVLPLRPYDNRVLAISKYPVTNKQYKAFIEDFNPKAPGILQYIKSKINSLRDRNTHTYKDISLFKEPEGEIFKDGRWTGPFYPWRDKRFYRDDFPVVCVSIFDATSYVLWLNNRRSDNSFSHNFNFKLVSESLWNYAAFGQEYPRLIKDNWINQTKSIHHRAESPISVFNQGERFNVRGVSDMFGNVWEWCNTVDASNLRIPLLAFQSDKIVSAELKGGGYLDDLTKITPFLTSSMLEDELYTKHTDLGFRVAAVISISQFSDETKQVLWSYEDESERLMKKYWEDY